MGEALLRREARRRDVDATFASAGVSADIGRPASDGAVEAVGEFDLDISSHVSRPADAAILDHAELIVTMEVDHVARIVADDHHRFAKTFAIRELADRARYTGPRAEDPLDEWLGALGEGRTARSLFGSADLDVSDPYGRSRSHYRTCAAELDELSSALGRYLWGPAPSV